MLWSISSKPMRSGLHFQYKTTKVLICFGPFHCFWLNGYRIKECSCKWNILHLLFFIFLMLLFFYQDESSEVTYLISMFIKTFDVCALCINMCVCVCMYGTQWRINKWFLVCIHVQGCVYIYTHTYMYIFLLIKMIGIS